MQLRSATTIPRRQLCADSRVWEKRICDVSRTHQPVGGFERVELTSVVDMRQGARSNEPVWSDFTR